MYFVAVFSLLFICSVNGVAWKDCGSKGSKVISVDVEGCKTPVCPLKKGTNATLDIAFIPSEDFDKSTAVVHGEVAGVNVKFPLPNADGCNNCNLQCPVPKGKQVTYRNSIYISELYPSVKVVVTWELQDKDGNDIFCVKLPTQVESYTAPEGAKFMSKTRPNHVFKNGYDKL